MAVLSPMTAGTPSSTGSFASRRKAYRWGGTLAPDSCAVGEAVILLHPPLPSVGVSMETTRECQQNDSPAAGPGFPLAQRHE